MVKVAITTELLEKHSFPVAFLGYRVGAQHPPYTLLETDVNYSYIDRHD